MKKIVALSVGGVLFLNIICLIAYKSVFFNTYVSYEMKADSPEILQIFWLTQQSQEYDETKSSKFYVNKNSLSEARFNIPHGTDISKLRIDFGDNPANLYIKNFHIRIGLFTKVAISNNTFSNIFTQLNQIEGIAEKDDFIHIKTVAGDGFAVSDADKFNTYITTSRSSKYLFEDTFIKIQIILSAVCLLFLILLLNKSFKTATATTLKKYKNSNYLFLLICFFLIFSPQVLVNINTGDYTSIRERALSMGILPLYRSIITTWSSRYIIDFTVVVITHLPVFIWHILNIFFVLLGAYSIRRLIAPMNQENRITDFFVLTLVLCYPFSQMSGAGWVVTTTTYLWPATALAYSLIIIKKILCAEEIHWYKYPLALLAFIYAVDSELAVVAMLPASFALLIFYFVKNKRIHWYLATIFIAALISIALDITSSGNKARFLAETQTWFPSYPTLSFFQKFHLGIDSTFATIMGTNPSIITALLLILLFINIYEKYGKKIYLLITSIPIVFLIWNDIIVQTGLRFYSPRHLNGMNYGIGNNFYFVFSLIVVFCVLYSLYLIYKNNINKFLLLSLILVCGFASRMVMIFSPTLFASGHRTFNILYLAIMIVSAQIFHDIMQNVTDKQKQYVYMIIGVVATLVYIANIF